MKHTLYEDPVTHRFALLRLPNKFVEGDKVPVSPTSRWFDTREDAVAALSELFKEDEESTDHPPDSSSNRAS